MMRGTAGVEDEEDEGSDATLRREDDGGHTTHKTTDRSLHAPHRQNVEHLSGIPGVALTMNSGAP